MTDKKADIPADKYCPRCSVDYTKTTLLKCPRCRYKLEEV